ncbi:hypothetical protein J2S18_001088 [Eubacterium multiforme]|uniref:ParB-like nuclease domain-containing protein n=1 Tax=Eubacterium multiforme TaxID=83339 RepID=A0ABT9US67_9FIRM|nr:hypothetical protein [Eubacterium multiforme]MDQ0149158.1 hypothetical protein [Eubacterium multiforme]
MTTTFINVSIDKLIVNPENYRFESVDNEDLAIKIMLDKHNKAIKELLKDILENGLNPLERLLVFEKNNNYIVLEGNRRVTALKIINDVNILKNIDQKYFKEYSKLIKNTKNKFSLDKVSCALTDDIPESNKWIGLKHTGSNGGRGTIPWDTTQKRRFLNNTTTNSKSNIVTSLYSYIKSNNYYCDSIKQNLDIIPVTTLERLLNDPYVRENIGIDIKRNTIYKLYPDIEISKPLKKVLNDLINKKIVVTDIYTKSHRIDYLDTFSEKDLPNYSTKLTFPIELLCNLNIDKLPLGNTGDNTNSNSDGNTGDNTNSNSDGNTGDNTNSNSDGNTGDNTNSNSDGNTGDNTNSNTGDNTNSNTGDNTNSNTGDNTNSNTDGKRDNNNINKRKFLIPSTFHARINVPRIQQIYKELKRLDVSEYPNSVSVLFRVFFELTVDEYIEQTNLQGITNNDKLNKKVQACIDDLKKKNLFDKYKAKPINVAISTNDSLFSINTFNSYVHNKHMIPDPMQLKNTWNQFESFILTLLNTTKK